MKTIATPLVGQLADKFIDRRLGADIDAAGRLVEDEDPAGQDQPAAQHAFLLIAAAQPPDGWSSERSLIPSRSTKSWTILVDARRPNHRRVAPACRARQAIDFSRTECGEHERIRLRSSGTKPMPRAIAWPGERLTVDCRRDEFRPPVPIRAEHQARDLGPAGPNQPGEPQNFARPERRSSRR